MKQNWEESAYNTRGYSSRIAQPCFPHTKWDISTQLQKTYGTSKISQIYQFFKWPLRAFNIVAR